MVSRQETIQTHLLRVFVEVARRRGVTAAADALGQPKSAVSKALSALERKVGARLVERSTRRVALTPTGAVLQLRAESILAEIDRLADAVREQSEDLRGAVRMTAPPELGALLAERFFPPLLAAHPGLEVSLDLGYAFDDLLDPRFDLAFRLGSVHDDRLVAKPIGGFRRIVVASPSYAPGRRVRTPRDLAQCNALGFSATEFKAVWTLESGRAERGARGPRSEEVTVRGNFAARGFTALLHAARAGLGVARVPAFAAGEALREGTLIRILPGWAAPTTGVFLVHRFGQERVRRVKTVVDTAQRELPRVLKAA